MDTAVSAISAAPANEVAVSSVREASSKPPEAAVAARQQNPSPSQASSPVVSREEADKAAQQLARTLNAIAGTELQFDVRVSDDEKGSSQGFRFQVVDKDTGKIVRSFPPEELGKISKRAQLNPPAGLLVDSKL